MKGTSSTSPSITIHTVSVRTPNPLEPLIARPAKVLDGPGTRTNRSEHRIHNDAAFFSRCFPESVDTTTTPILASVAESDVQHSDGRGWVPGYFCSDSTICLLKHTATAAGASPYASSKPAHAAAGRSASDTSTIGSSNACIVFFRLSCIYIGLLKPFANHPICLER